MPIPKTLTTDQLGERIATLRKGKGWSQEDLAKWMGLTSRTALAQIEVGKRNVTVQEAYRLAVSMGISVDALLSPDSAPEPPIESEPFEPESSSEIRVAVPELQVAKFRQVLLYILERCAGKPNVGETVLYKLLYFSDFNHYEQYEEHLTGATYRKLAHGPVPFKVDQLLNQMVQDGKLQRVKTEFLGYAQTRYIPLTKPDLTQLRASEKDVMDKVIDQMGDWTATAISEYSHRDLPWKATADKDIIDYELVFYRDAPFSVRRYDDEAS